MKKNRQKAGDRSHSLGAQQLAAVRGGGIQGTGHATSNAIIDMQTESGVLPVP